MHLGVADLQLVVWNPQAAGEQADDLEQDEGDQTVPDDDGQGREQLDEQLFGMAVEQTLDGDGRATELA